MTIPKTNWDAVRSDVSDLITNLSEVEQSLQHSVGDKELWESLIKPAVEALLELVFYAKGQSHSEIRERWLDGEIQSN
jgi:hypothetical protein